MAKKKILLYADSYGGRVGTSEAYVQFLSQFGEVILVSADNDLDFFIDKVGDVLAMPGGADIDPMRYGETPASSYGRTNPHYEYLDEFLLLPWIKTGKPIIGICRGMQSLNVALGGTLHQHIHGHIGGDDRSKQEFELFTDIEGYQYYETNSYHHQAVKDVAENMVVIGWSFAYKHCPSIKSRKTLIRHYYEVKKDTKGKKRVSKAIDYMTTNHDPEMMYMLPEIIRHQTLPYIGIQYHPEEYNCPLAVMLINDILNPEG